MPNRPPVISNIASRYVVQKGGSLQLHPTVTDPDGNTLTYYVSKAQHGQVIQPGGADRADVTYVPTPDYVGSDMFSFYVNDGREGGFVQQVIVVQVVDQSSSPSSGASDAEIKAAYARGLADGQSRVKEAVTKVLKDFP